MGAFASAHRCVRAFMRMCKLLCDRSFTHLMTVEVLPCNRARANIFRDSSASERTYELVRAAAALTRGVGWAWCAPDTRWGRGSATRPASGLRRSPGSMPWNRPFFLLDPAAPTSLHLQNPSSTLSSKVTGSPQHSSACLCAHARELTRACAPAAVHMFEE